MLMKLLGLTITIKQAESEVKDMEISVITNNHPLWEKTISFAESCSWKAGAYLAKKMRNNEFAEAERVIVATENNAPVGYCTFALKD